MESSITRPIATVIAPSVIIFNVISIQFNRSNAMKIETGIDTIEIIVDLKSRKNNKMINTAIKPPNNAFSIIVFTDSSIGAPWSRDISTTSPSILLSSSSINSFTLLTTSTVFAC